MKFKKALSIAAIAVATVTGAAACSGSSAPSANKRDQQVSTSILSQYENSQPVPQFKWSQIRQTAIDIETAQAHSTQTTTFFFNQGVTKPVMSCPSVGFPVASTTELTNPQQVVNSYDQGVSSATIAQIDPNGIFAGDSTGTYVLCVNGKGGTYGVYWEGFVYAATGPAVWDDSSNSVRMTGPSSFTFTTKP